MINLYKKEQLEELKEKYLKEVIEEVEEIITLLNDNYGANRDVDKDLGGYIALLESKEDVAEIKANSIKGLLPEYTDIIRSDDGIDYYSSLFLLSDDYSIVVFSTKELHEILIEKEL
ncbi:MULTISPECIES: hypothetical protein [unclassified Clostridium]|uniref:hypothetical protein n=1 Tax=unclassified Clostridium TaxID=2614128 RepID=UPI00029825B8|nr:MULTISPECIES: hypothetical protein [unclassified Clostridium]EKQ55884.1 MAG: hypothetical protein A370_02457 [Clostridium sp. Maddingley MBC34-26]